MDTLDKLLDIVQVGIPGKMLQELNPSSETEIIQNLEVCFDKIKTAFLDINLRGKLIEVLTAYSEFEAVESLLNQKVYLNEFSNKYGKKYIQARTSISKSDGKTSWINAYVGPLENYKLGIKDPSAIKLGRELMRKKLLEKGIFKLNYRQK